MWLSKSQARNAAKCATAGKNNINLIKSRQLRATHTKFYQLEHILRRCSVLLIKENNLILSYFNRDDHLIN